MTVDAGTVPITLFKGSDEVVQRDAVRRVVDDLVGEEDRGLVVEEVEVGHAKEGERDPILTLVDAAQTPPFLTDFRVVVGRVVEKRERAELVQPLVEYLSNPLPSTRLVVDWNGGRIPKALTEAIAAVGGAQVDTSPGGKKSSWVGDQLAAAGLKIDAAGQRRLGDWLGEDAGRLVGLIEVLVSTYGPGARIGAEEIEPFLGDDGGVPPWDLTDAIDRGDRRTALELLHRMMGQGARHPFQLFSTLNTHYSRILRLDGADVRGDADAAEILGVKGFPAKKALGQARRMGHDRIVRAIDLLAQADLDLRGSKAWPNELVMEVLVARLATLSK